MAVHPYAGIQTQSHPFVQSCGSGLIVVVVVNEQSQVVVGAPVVVVVDVVVDVVVVVVEVVVEQKGGSGNVSVEQKVTICVASGAHSLGGMHSQSTASTGHGQGSEVVV